MQELLMLLVCTSWIYWLVVWWSMRKFFRAARPEAPAFAPAVSILKPVKGLDAGAYENFASFCRQDYPEFELVFGVADERDPAVELVYRLQEEFPQRLIRLLVVPEAGHNPKSSTLDELCRQAHYDVLVISDSDIRVTPDYLRRVVAPLADARTGLVTCPYRSVEPASLTARMESLYLDTTFLPQAISACSVFGTRFAMGATIAVRSVTLEQVGGYGAIVDYLSDDYHIAARVAALGLKVVVSDYVVENVLGATSFRQQWEREVRWARSIRVLRPREYPGLVLTFSTPLAAGLMPLTGFSPFGCAALAVSLVLRWLFAFNMLGYLGHRRGRRWLPLLPLRDALTSIVWVLGVFGRYVSWRGRSFRLMSDNRLRPVPSGGIVRRAVVPLVERLDAFLRWRMGIHEFTDHRECLFRWSLHVAKSDWQFADGTVVRRGERVGEIHYWNEHMPQVPEGGADVAWAQAFRRGMLVSFRELARHIEQNPELADVVAIHGEFPFDSRNAGRAIRRVGSYFGFEVLEPTPPSGVWQRLHAVGGRMLLWALVWAYNPASLRDGRLTKHRWPVRMTRQSLLTRHGRAAAPTKSAAATEALVETTTDTPRVLRPVGPR